MSLTLFEKFTTIVTRMDNLRDYISRYEPVGINEGSVALKATKNGWEIEINSNILFNGKRTWTSVNVHTLVDKVLKEITDLTIEEMSFPRHFLVDSEY